MNKKHILITGSDGQLGSELKYTSTDFPVIAFYFTTRETLSIEDTSAVERFISDNNITHCINCAAYTAVDKAEEETESAFRINASAVGNLGTITKKMDCKLIHISTDYVFNGNANKPYTEDHETDPVNLYGRSKLEGEEALSNNPDSIIIRTSWLYSSYGRNFVKTMIRLMKEKESIGVVSDQYGSPTYAADLAAAIIKIILQDSPKAGIYHYSNNGIISWYDFAMEIKKTNRQ